MSPDLTHTIFYAIAAVCGIIWLIGTRYAVSRYKSPASQDPYRAMKADEDSHVTGEVTVNGDAARLEQKLVDAISALGSVGGGAFLKITDRSPGRIAFDRVAAGSPGFGAGEFLLEPDDDRVRIRYKIDFTRFTSIMRTITYFVCFVYGGAIVVGVPVLIWLYVVNTDDETVRWQVLQTAQMIHGVWPPFLLGFLAGRIRKMVVARFDTMLANLEHAS